MLANDVDVLVDEGRLELRDEAVLVAEQIALAKREAFLMGQAGVADLTVVA